MFTSKPGVNRRGLARTLAAICTLCGAYVAAADIKVFGKNLDGFNNAAGNPPILIDFDSIEPGTDITDATIRGVTFHKFDAPLLVVVGNDTYTPDGFTGVKDPETNKLFPTTDANVLSPGGLELGPGPNKPIENDDIELVFAKPVAAFGFDHLSQSADGAGFSYIQVFDINKNKLYAGWIPISDKGGAGAPGWADFWGIVSSEKNIARVVIDESDNNNQYPDCNIGIDTLRLFPPLAKGDMNCDGSVDFNDIDPFVTALISRDDYEAQYPACEWLNGDINGDGSTDFNDIDGFVECIINGGC